MFRHARMLMMLCAIALSVCVSAWGTPIRLITVIVVDGLPTELLLRHADRLNPEGLGRLLRSGTVYTGADIPWLTTFTAVGHAGLFTGALPDQHGIIGNEWLDPSTGEQVYCVEDPAHQILDFPGKAHDGVSPANLLSTTLGDEMIRTWGHQARVFGVSTKDRGAILPAGKRGKAFWYHKSAGTMVISTYYYEKSPDWLISWRNRFAVSQYRNAVWQLLRAPEAYDRLAEDDRKVENSPLGATFPHDLSRLDDAQSNAELPWTPFIDEITLDLALTILEAESLGKDDIPDMLSISFSSMDYIHHRYGPDSLESEDTLYRVDELIVRLLSALEQQIGLDRVMIALSSDHGFGRAPEQIQTEGLPARRITKPELNACMNDLAGQLSSISGIAVTASFSSPFIYLRRQDGDGLDATVRAQAVRIANSWSWTQWAASIDDIRSGNIPRTPFHERALTAHAAGRGGDVLVIAKPWHIVETAETAWSATHGSPYAYDTRVPMVFAGPGIAAGWVSRPVSPLDIAATLAACLNITPPPACSGTPLPEIVDGLTDTETRVRR
ncbi:MAG TPA: alkaline phosphatase family protein [Candidatus Hydrogenedentes bacterium]|nr:alkaline phosphatase family protein [Candidatus Hydrogenedentota bacterium]